MASSNEGTAETYAPCTIDGVVDGDRSEAPSPLQPKSTPGAGTEQLSIHHQSLSNCSGNEANLDSRATLEGVNDDECPDHGSTSVRRSIRKNIKNFPGSTETQKQIASMGLLSHHAHTSTSFAQSTHNDGNHDQEDSAAQDDPSKQNDVKSKARESIESSNESGKPEKRKRGRPRKVNVSIEPSAQERTTSSEHENTAFQVVKRKRGRPRKYHAISDSEVTKAPEEGNSVGLSQKRKRGRPRKNPIDSEKMPVPLSTDSVQSEGSAQPTLVGDTAVVIKRKRGRPRKGSARKYNVPTSLSGATKPERRRTTTTTTGTTFLIESPRQDTMEPFSPAEKRRGDRSRKHPLGEERSSPLVFQHNDAIKRSIARRKRGRPRKNHDSRKGLTPLVKRRPGWILGGTNHARSASLVRTALEPVQPLVSSVTQMPETPEESVALRQHWFGQPCQNLPLNICVVCLGTRHKELMREPILLCDGCNREFHLQCCTPQISSIPEDSYYCLQCDKLGSSADLISYFQVQMEKRLEFLSSKQFVTHQLRLKQKKQRGAKMPLSELRMMSHRQTAISKGHKSSKPTPPEFLVGKPVRILCCNTYHNGRIIGWRRISDGTKEFWSNDVEDIEYLIRFPPGMDNRKEMVQEWILLEEHSMAVGFALVWASDTPDYWRPGIVWLRTSLELFPIQALLSHADGHIAFVGDERVEPTAEKTIWGAVTTFDEDFTEPMLLDLKNETVALLDSSMAKKQKSGLERADQRTRTGLAMVEWEEQNRVQKWSQMGVADPLHNNALGLSNEMRFNDNTADEVCPLIEHSCDRPFILDKLTPSLSFRQDNAVDCEFVLVDPSPDSISQFVNPSTK